MPSEMSVRRTFQRLFREFENFPYESYEKKRPNMSLPTDTLPDKIYCEV